MKSTFDLMRFWAVITGLALAAWFFVALYLGFKVGDTLPMLIAGIGGFEMVLYGQDLWLKRGRRHG